MSALKNQGDTLKSQGQTMLNLQSKRTLPRQVIKWMQGLDLSYSIKDYRKDMNNGFLIGEIISRYEPGKIPMHALENSQNVNRRENNWKLIHLFFTKYTLKEVKVEASQYNSIISNNDPKSQHLHQFVCRLYSLCTKRPLPESAPTIDLPPTNSNNPNLTASYILKDDTLEKLNPPSLNAGLQNQQNSVSQNNSIVEEDRVPTRKISPNAQIPEQVDVKSIGIWGEGNKVTSKKKSWVFEGREESQFSQDNVDNERMVFDYLNEILEQCMNSSQKFEDNRTLLLENNSYKPTEMLKNTLEKLNRDLVCSFLGQVIASVNELVPIVLRQTNQIWKFFIYFIRMLRNLPDQSQELILAIQLIRQYSKHAHERQSKRILKVFADSLLPSLIIQAKATTSWRKRQRIMIIVYYLGGNDNAQKKLVLFNLKQHIGSSNPLYLQWLTVLVQDQPKDSSLLQDYIYYAHQNLNSSLANLRTSSLKILSFASTNSLSLVEEYFLVHMETFTQCKDPQHIYLLSKIYFNILSGTFSSNAYQNLVKGAANTNLIKVYNPDHEKQEEEIRNKIIRICECLGKLYAKTQNTIVREIISKMAVDFIGQDKQMAKIVLQEMSHDRSAYFLKQQKVYFQLKSLEGEMEPVDLVKINQNSHQILILIINLVVEENRDLLEYRYLINHCLANLNVKKINMEAWENISLHLIRPITILLPNAQYSESSKITIQNTLNLHFNFDLKIKNFNNWIAEAISKILFEKNVQCLAHVTQFNIWLNQIYKSQKNDQIRFTIEQISSLIQIKGFKGVIHLT